MSLADLRRFFAHPVRGFFRRLRIARPYAADEVKDAIPITLDALEKWAVGVRLASEVLGGADAIAVGEALKVTGQLPPGPLGKGVLDEIVTVVRPRARPSTACCSRTSAAGSSTPTSGRTCRVTSCGPSTGR